MRLYTCYWSPNTLLSEFHDFLARLESSIRTTSLGVLIASYFNAEHSNWGSTTCEKRGDALANLIHAIGLVVCNRGNPTTFRRKNSESIIDITFASPSIAARTSGWRVSEDLTLSDHQYIEFKINTDHNANFTNLTMSKTRINLYRPIAALEAGMLDVQTQERSADECAELFTASIKEACMEKKPTRTNNKKSVYWWSPEIGKLRKNEIPLRRIFQRRKRRLVYDLCKLEEEKAKIAKFKLVKAIKKAKEDG